MCKRHNDPPMCFTGRIALYVMAILGGVGLAGSLFVLAYTAKDLWP